MMSLILSLSSFANGTKSQVLQFDGIYFLKSFSTKGSHVAYNTEHTINCVETIRLQSDITLKKLTILDHSNNMKWFSILDIGEGPQVRTSCGGLCERKYESSLSRSGTVMTHSRGSFPFRRMHSQLKRSERTLQLNYSPNDDLSMNCLYSK